MKRNSTTSKDPVGAEIKERILQVILSGEALFLESFQIIPVGFADSDGNEFECVALAVDCNCEIKTCPPTVIVIHPDVLMGGFPEALLQCLADGQEKQ